MSFTDQTVDFDYDLLGEPDAMSSYFPSTNEDPDWNSRLTMFSMDFLSEAEASDGQEQAARHNVAPPAQFGYAGAEHAVQAYQTAGTSSASDSAGQPFASSSSPGFHAAPFQSMALPEQDVKPKLRRQSVPTSSPFGSGGMRNGSGSRRRTFASVSSAAKPQIGSANRFEQPNKRHAGHTRRIKTNGIAAGASRRSSLSSNGYLPDHTAPPVKREADTRAHEYGGALNASSRVCAMWLTSADEGQCRFAVKNDEKESNCKLEFVQSNGYVEYKARYCKKRGNHAGYGHFHIGFLPTSRIIYPLMRMGQEQGDQQPAAGQESLLHFSEVQSNEIDRMEITIRLYQSFRGQFPARVASFTKDESYHPLFVKEWQDSTLMKQYEQSSPSITTTVEKDGEYLRFTIQDRDTLVGITSKDGVAFPCPLPIHPEKLNDIGMLRMQVSVKFFTMSEDAAMSPLGESRLRTGDEFNVWIKMKIVQQLSGKKRKFSDMRRQDTTNEWHYPPRPSWTAIAQQPADVLEHWIGPNWLQGSSAAHLLRLLATRVAETEDTGSSHHTALHEAAAYGQLGLCQMLLQANLGLVNTQNEDNRTPLHLAAWGGHLHVVESLYKCGAYFDVPDVNGNKPLHLAEQAGHQRVVAFIREKEQREELDCGAISRAACVGHIRCIRHALLQGSADINAVNEQGMSPLILATIHKRPFTAHNLLIGGADPFIQDLEGQTAMHYAAAKGHIEIVVMLAHQEHGTVTAEDSSRRTPLHAAAEAGQVLVVDILMSCGADPLAVDCNDHKPADLAAGNEHYDVHLLLTALGNGGAVPSDFTLRNRMAGDLFSAAISGDVAQIRRLIAMGVEPTEENAEGDTALFLAALHGNLLALDELVVISVANHWPLTKARIDGWTPIHAACARGSIGCLLVLLSTKLLDLNAQTSSGSTALHLAASHGYALCCCFLLLAGADIRVPDADGKTAVDIAADRHHSATLQVCSASSEQLMTVSRALENKLGPGAVPRHDDSAALEDADKIFNWQGFDLLLSRVWHSTHEIRNIIGATRAP